jgi:hypothetical protein
MTVKSGRGNIEIVIGQMKLKQIIRLTVFVIYLCADLLEIKSLKVLLGKEIKESRFLCYLLKGMRVEVKLLINHGG